jgi:hypothetical protein
MGEGETLLVRKTPLLVVRGLSREVVSITFAQSELVCTGRRPHGLVVRDLLRHSELPVGHRSVKVLLRLVRVLLQLVLILRDDLVELPECLLPSCLELNT